MKDRVRFHGTASQQLMSRMRKKWYMELGDIIGRLRKPNAEYEDWIKAMRVFRDIEI